MRFTTERVNALSDTIEKGDLLQLSEEEVEKLDSTQKRGLYSEKDSQTLMGF